MYQVVLICRDNGKSLLRSIGPGDLHRLNHCVITQTKMEPLAGLGQKALPSGNSLRLERCPRLSQCDGRSKGVPGCNSLQSEREEMMALWRLVAKKANLWRGARGYPQIQTAVMVPVDNGDAAGIVRKIQAADC